MKNNFKKIYFTVAMSFPGSGLETTYRNDLKDVAKMLKTKHQQNFMVSYHVCHHGDIDVFVSSMWCRSSTCQRGVMTSQSLTIR